MTKDEIHTVATLADMLRSKGVRVFRGGGFELELTSLDIPEKSKPSADPEMCGCGHEVYTHMNGLCTAGCDEAKCATKEA